MSVIITISSVYSLSCDSVSPRK